VLRCDPEGATELPTELKLPAMFPRQVPIAFGLGGPAASSFININLNQLMKKGKLNAKKIET
jgi:hypothetical protein